MMSAPRSKLIRGGRGLWEKEGCGKAEEEAKKKTTRMDRDDKEANGGGDGVCDFCLQAPVFQDSFGGGGVCARVCCVLCVYVLCGGGGWRVEERRAKKWRLICSQRGQGDAKEGTAVDSRFSFPGLRLGMLGLQVPMRPGSIDDPGVGGVGLPRRRTPVHGNSRFTVLALLLFSFSPLMGWLSPCVTTTGGSAERSATWYRGGPTD
ncbi:hypothetical protein BKA56DRAFT_567298 [Ilyonectria sp. MPI-CAGE-AT-0026]|nr:hypothetical protein BKA56DRAFT_567298 [Ilyonectria sp. MPI-CAGE-AT-0026]